jgi:hypothetical protein
LEEEMKDMKYIFLFLFGLAAMLTLVVSQWRASPAATRTKAPTPAGTPVPYSLVENKANGSLVTVEHDGHKFIVHSSSQKSAMLHHPSCPCIK